MSSIKTINFNNPANFVFDAAKVEITTDGHLLPESPADEISHANFRVDANLTRGLGALTTTLVSGAALATVGGNQYIVTSGAGSRLSFDDLANSRGSDREIFGVRFKFNSPYSGTPVSSSSMYHESESYGSANSYLVITHEPTGKLNLFVNSSTGGTKVRFETTAAVNFTLDQEYELSFYYDTNTSSSYIFVDGVPQALTIIGLATVGAVTVGYAGIGSSHLAATDSRIRDFQLFSTIQDTVDHSGDIPRDVPIYPSEESIESLESTSLDGFYDYTSVVTESGDSKIGYAAKVNGVLSYVSGGAIIPSDGTYAQTNTLAEIDAAKDIINAAIGDGGSLIQYVVLKSSTDGITTPTITSTTLTYDFYATETVPGVCTVWGYIKDGELPVENASVLFTNISPKFNDGSLVSVNIPTLSRSTGYFDANIPETATTGGKINVKIEFEDSNGVTRKRTFDIIVPNQSEAQIDTIIA